MSDIQITLHRFTLDETWGMDPQPDGEWVRFDEVLDSYRLLIQHLRDQQTMHDAQAVDHRG